MKKLSVLAICSVLLFGCAPAQREAEVEGNVIVLDFAAAEQEISEYIYGHFAEHLGRGIYEGIWVGPDSDIPNVNGFRTDVIEALQKLNIPVLRWPGGCFADTYNWRNGIGPRDQRPTMVNTFWGGNVENNHFGTHEFFELCELLGAEAYVNVNVGSGSPREMIEWIEYMTADGDGPMAKLRRANGQEEPWDVKFLGIGNEMWGCGGQMTAETFAQIFRTYGHFARQYGGPDMIRIAAGGYGDNYDWNDVLLANAEYQMDGISIHYYTIPTGDWGNKSAATGFCDSLYFSSFRNAKLMETHVQRHVEILDTHDPDNRIGLYVAEWGIWTDQEPGSVPGFLYQQNTMRDAIIASLHFDIFHRYAERIRGANIAQMVNVLQAMILTDGPRMLLTPTYHVFNMYQVHQNATKIPLTIQSEPFTLNGESLPSITATASIKDGIVNIGVSNIHATEAREVVIDVSGGNLAQVANAVILTAPAINSHNTFDNPNVVVPAEFTAYQLEGGKITVTMPPHSIVKLKMN